MAVGCRAVQAAEEKAFSDIIAKVTWKQDSDSTHHFRYFLTLEGAHVKYIALLASSNSSLDTAPEEHLLFFGKAGYPRSCLQPFCSSTLQYMGSTQPSTMAVMHTHILEAKSKQTTRA